MANTFPDYDIDSVIKDATAFQVLDWFVKAMPAAHEPADRLMFPEERVPRDIWLLSIMWGNAFYSLINDCEGRDDIYRANTAMKFLPPSKATTAVAECVSILDKFSVQDGVALIPDENPEFHSKIREFDSHYFYKENLWAESHTLARDVYQFILSNLDVYRQRKFSA